MDRDDPSAARSIETLAVPATGAVVRGRPGGPAWRLVDAAGAEVEFATPWLWDLYASDYSPATLRSYAYDLLSWLRFLSAVKVGWTQASRWEVRDWVRWHLLHRNDQRTRSRREGGHRPSAGTVNSRTGKPYLQVPLTQRWDPHERVLSEPLPHLLIYHHNSNLHVVTPVSVHAWLDDLAARLNLNIDGTAVKFTPHDFRRIFATEAVANGIPPHIVQVLLGHRSLATTQGYTAIYPQDVIRAHRSYIRTRRRTRPSEEYREPTAEEWAEFEAHFVQRKVSLGSCGRGYGTACQHEHACIRCGLLRPDPAQADRLRDIIANLGERIDEAEENNWLGDVEGLKISLDAARLKLEQMDRQATAAETVDLGLPSFPQHGRNARR